MSGTTTKVILIDDDEAMRMSSGQYLELADCEVRGFKSAVEALDHLETDFCGVIVSDVKMPGMDGLELLKHIRALDPELPVVLVTAHGDVAMAVDAMRDGAYSFLEKPFQPERLLDEVNRAAAMRWLVLENRALREELKNTSGLDRRLLGASPAIERVRQAMRDVVDTDASVFLTGETGTGKEVVARCLHDFGKTAKGPFVAVNCAAIPESMIESELFGHVEGAFTGAQAKRVGKLVHADGGTLFLDEIGSMPVALQAKLLRALQEGEVVPLGGNTPVSFNARIISACNQDLRKACAEGRFRDDLYYRLNVFEITLPPLRERGEDIPLLFEYFLSQAAERFEREAPRLSALAVAQLMGLEWRGNVRELKNFAERFALSTLPEEERIAALLGCEAKSATGLSEQVRQFERSLIEVALRKHDGNIMAVMEYLDIPRRTLNEKMVKYGLERKG